MSRKIERLYEQATGWDPKKMEPKPDGPHMQNVINRRIKTEFPPIRPDDPSRYQILKGEDGNGVYTAIVDPENQKIAYVDGDHTRNPKVLTLLKEGDWINIRDEENFL